MASERKITKDVSSERKVTDEVSSKKKTTKKVLIGSVDPEDKRTVVVPDQDGRGKGLIAGKDIKKNERIISYPSYVYSEEESIKLVSQRVLTNEYTQNCDGKVYHADQNNPTGGWLINDPTPTDIIIGLSKVKNIRELIELKIEYEKYKGNVGHKIIKGELIAFAKEAIKKGEPIFCSYGLPYWIGNIQAALVEPNYSSLADKLHKDYSKSSRSITFMTLLVDSLIEETFPFIGYMHDIKYLPKITDEGLKLLTTHTKTKPDIKEDLYNAWLRIAGLPETSEQGYYKALRIVGYKYVMPSKMSERK